jgi:glycosyltransferase involved in cell wall biosynthesis
MKPKIHYHSHASTFSGAENMLTIFLQSRDFKSNFELSFSYGYSKKYHKGFLARIVKFKGDVYPLNFIHFYSYKQLPELIPVFFRRIIFYSIQFLIFYPLIIYEVYIFRRLFLKIAPDILHINNGGYPAAISSRAAAIAGRLARIPCIVFVVNNMAVGYKNYFRWFEYPIDRLVTICVNIFITGSKAAANQLRKVLQLSKAQVTSINNCIILRNGEKKNLGQQILPRATDFNRVIFGVVASLIHRKGHQVLLDALLTLVNGKKITSEKIIILIEGSGPLYKTLTDFVISNNLSDYVSFIGCVENIHDFMYKIDVLILPSIENEDFPNVVLEAMALAKPVIVSNLAGTPEQVIDGLTGVLVEPRNIEQLAQAILLLMSSLALRRSMGLAGKKRFRERFTDTIVLKKYSNLYKKILRKKTH